MQVPVLTDAEVADPVAAAGGRRFSATPAAPRASALAGTLATHAARRIRIAPAQVPIDAPQFGHASSVAGNGLKQYAQARVATPPAEASAPASTAMAEGSWGS